MQAYRLIHKLATIIMYQWSRYTIIFYSITKWVQLRQYDYWGYQKFWMVLLEYNFIKLKIEASYIELIKLWFKNGEYVNP